MNEMIEKFISMAALTSGENLVTLAESVFEGAPKVDQPSVLLFPSLALIYTVKRAVTKELITKHTGYIVGYDEVDAGISNIVTLGIGGVVGDTEL